MTTIEEYVRQVNTNIELSDEIKRLNKELDIAIDICNKRQVEIVRLNNIITELDNYIVDETRNQKLPEIRRFYLDIWCKLKELKEK